MKKNKLITTIIIFTLLTLSQICTAFGTIITAGSDPHPIEYRSNDLKNCEKCGKPMPVNVKCPRCNR